MVEGHPAEQILKLIDGELFDLVIVGRTVSGAMKKVSLDLVQDVTKGDKVLLCDGVAIAKSNDSQITNFGNHVLGDSR